MLHDLFTIEVIGNLQGGLNNFEHNCMSSLKFKISRLDMRCPLRSSDFLLDWLCIGHMTEWVSSGAVLLKSDTCCKILVTKKN